MLVIHERERLKRWSVGRAGVLALAGVGAALVVGAVNPAFLAWGNAASVLASVMVVVIAAVGVGVVVAAGEIDISGGALYGLLGALLGVMSSPTHLGWPVWAVVLAVVGAGALVGLVNGVMVVVGRAPSIVATLAMMSVLKGLTQVVLGGVWVTDVPAGVRWLGTAELAGAPVSVWVGAAVVVAAAGVMRRTRAGVMVYATGDNPAAAGYARVRTGAVKVWAFVASGALVGVAACVCVPRLAVVESGLGAGLELAAVTAVVVGGVSMSGGRGGLMGVAMAAVLLGMIPSVAVYLKGPLGLGEGATHWERAVYGACILGAVVADRGRSRGASVGDDREGPGSPWVQAGVLGAVLAGLMGAAWWVEPGFVAWGAQMSLAPEMAMVGLLAVGMTLVILTGGIDLSVGSTMALSAVAAGLMVERGAAWWAAAMGAVAVGTAAGWVNGAVITRWRVHPLVVTLATLALYGGIAEGVSRGRPLPEGVAGGFGAGWTGLGRAEVLGVPVVLVPAAVAAVLAAAVLWRGAWGFKVRAVGLNETAARYCGVAADRVKVWVYTLSGAAAGLAACLFIARRNTAKADVGAGIELEVITACVLGGVSLSGGRGGLAGVMTAVVLLHEVRQFVAWRWQNDEVILFVLGGLLAASVMASNLIRRRG